MHSQNTPGKNSNLSRVIHSPKQLIFNVIVSMSHKENTHSAIVFFSVSFIVLSVSTDTLLLLKIK